MLHFCWLLNFTSVPMWRRKTRFPHIPLCTCGLCSHDQLKTGGLKGRAMLSEGRLFDLGKKAELECFSKTIERPKKGWKARKQTQISKIHNRADGVGVGPPKGPEQVRSPAGSKPRSLPGAQGSSVLWQSSSLGQGSRLSSEKAGWPAFQAIAFGVAVVKPSVIDLQAWGSKLIPSVATNELPLRPPRWMWRERLQTLPQTGPEVTARGVVCSRANLLGCHWDSCAPLPCEQRWAGAASWHRASACWWRSCFPADLEERFWVGYAAVRNKTRGWLQWSLFKQLNIMDFCASDSNYRRVFLCCPVLRLFRCFAEKRCVDSQRVSQRWSMLVCN